MRGAFLTLFAAGLTSHASCGENWSGRVQERQITFAPHGHILANCNVWSPDSQWIAYDCRDAGEKFSATRIEMVNTSTGETKPLFNSRDGANCGVATWNPIQPEIVFILGPSHPTKDWNYSVSHRRGVLMRTDHPGTSRPLDAMNYAPPFQPGALRGGTHVHVFNGSGDRVSFSYDDDIRHLASKEPDGTRSQRNIGVATPDGPVRVNTNHSRNNDGEWFSIVASQTVATPPPGSDEIKEALEEAWIGTNGYLREDGTRQRLALAFQGVVADKSGSPLREVFVIDLPEDLSVAGDLPLEGTSDHLPTPPLGTKQRRITYTEGRKFPGIQGPRHWLRSSPDGEHIAFLMKDEVGVVQIHLVSPRGGPIRQLTSNPWSVTSTFTWSPDGRWIAHAMDNSVFITDTRSGQSFRLTERESDDNAPHRSACVFSPDGHAIAYLKRRNGILQIFTASIPSS